MKGTRRLAAFGLAVTLACLSAAPPAVAAPRVEEPPRTGLLAFHEFADQLADLFGDWIRSVFAPAGGDGDPNG